MPTWGWDAKLSPDKAAALKEYFSQPMLNPTSGSHPEINIPGALHPLQYRWLGLSAEIKLVEQRIEKMDRGSIPDLELAYKELSALERKQRSLEPLMHIKGLAVPDPYMWRHPVFPDGWLERYKQDLIDFPRKAQAEMNRNVKSQTGEGKKKGKPKKGRAIRPKAVKIKK